VRRNGDAYEARGTPLADHPWQAVDADRHRSVGGIKLLHALPMCELAPQILDCTWAKLGCARPDLDGSGAVDDADRSLFDAAQTAHEGQPCNDGNGWCGGADLDRDGTANATDEAFLTAATGCHYE